jgi:hypothetical protein
MKDPLPSRRLACPALIGLAIASVGFAASGETRPNVLFIMADDYRAELATYGSAALTPNLTRLARRAVQFDRAYCQQAVCNPSLGSAVMKVVDVVLSVVTQNVAMESIASWWEPFPFSGRKPSA